MYHVLETETFTESLADLDPFERRWVEKMKDQYALSLNVGKPLRAGWLFEKKLKGLRLYVVIHNHAALFVDISRKSNQDKTIETLSEGKEHFFSIIERA